MRRKRGKMGNNRAKLGEIGQSWAKKWAKRGKRGENWGEIGQNGGKSRKNRAKVGQIAPNWAKGRKTGTKWVKLDKSGQNWANRGQRPLPWRRDLGPSPTVCPPDAPPPPLPWGLGGGHGGLGLLGGTGSYW